MAETSPQQHRTNEVLDNLKDLCARDDVLAQKVAHGLDKMLDDMAADDMFGTERQNDPRGDGRDDEPPRTFFSGITQGP